MAEQGYAEECGMAAGRCGSVGESGEEAINIIKEAYCVLKERLDGVIKIAIEM